MTPALAALGTFAAASKTSSSSSLLYIIIALFAAAYFLFLRPQSQRAKRMRADQLEQQRSFSVGDEVLTAGGIIGRVIDEQGDRITMETSVGASFTVLREYIVRRIEEPEPEAPDGEAEPEAADEGEAATGDAGNAAGQEDGGKGSDSGEDGDGHDDSGSTGK